MKIGKRHLIMAGLVLALGAAVYLNWQFSDNSSLLTPTSTLESSKELGKAEYVNNTTDSTVPSSKETAATESNSADSTVQSDANINTEEYFAQAKTDRQTAQDKITDLAKEVLESAESDSEAKAKAIASAALLAQNIERQSNIENLLKAKGFNDCLVFIQNDECSIVVHDTDLTDEDVLLIKDTAKGQSGTQFDKIKITGV